MTKLQNLIIPGIIFVIVAGMVYLIITNQPVKVSFEPKYQINETVQVQGKTGFVTKRRCTFEVNKSQAELFKEEGSCMYKVKLKWYPLKWTWEKESNITAHKEWGDLKGKVLDIIK